MELELSTTKRKSTASHPSGGAGGGTSRPPRSSTSAADDDEASGVDVPVVLPGPPVAVTEVGAVLVEPLLRVRSLGGEGEVKDDEHWLLERLPEAAPEPAAPAVGAVVAHAQLQPPVAFAAPRLRDGLVVDKPPAVVRGLLLW